MKAYGRALRRTEAGAPDHGIVGCGPLSEETKSLDRLIAMADAEMYRSKKTGKNRASVIRKSVGDA
jgi:PleD family two-component response regulator